jgi:hypothetical protein
LRSAVQVSRHPVCTGLQNRIVYSDAVTPNNQPASRHLSLYGPLILHFRLDVIVENIEVPARGGTAMAP